MFLVKIATWAGVNFGRFDPVTKLSQASPLPPGGSCAITGGKVPCVPPGFGVSPVPGGCGCPGAGFAVVPGIGPPVQTDVHPGFDGSTAHEYPSRSTCANMSIGITNP